eukprot:TRINITY_DN4400_c0_g1_i8.p1 TRINITY_DN4400_c0_g1~~TRINITY_DN4400_c0_g1_i8.p1  ORF type:complete len:831 (-),score=192.34 TRINITY_DN4400_c0_g1_i8:633-3125(-)
MTETTAHHVFVPQRFQKPVSCKSCSKQIWGFSTSKRMGFVCKFCLDPVHKKCVPTANKKICQEALLSDNYIEFKDVIKGCCLRDMQKLLYNIQQDGNLGGLPKKLSDSTCRIMNASLENFNVQLGEDIDKVWNDKFIQKIYESRWREWQIPQGADYFFDNSIRIGDPDYRPNRNDTMRARPQEQAKSYKDRDFRVWLPQGFKQVFIYDANTILNVILVDTKKAHNIEVSAEYTAWHHETGQIIENTMVPLSSLDVLEIYYYPNGRSPLSATNRRTLVSTHDRGRLGPPLKDTKRLSSGKASTRIKKKEDEIEERNGTLILEVGQGQNLANNTPWFTSLYLIISSDVSDKQCRSQPTTNTEIPDWGRRESFKFPVNCDTVEFTLKVWATNLNPRNADILLGQCTVQCFKFRDGDSRFGVVKLKKEPKRFKKNKDLGGELQVHWKYMDKRRKAQPTDIGGPGGPGTTAGGVGAMGRTRAYSHVALVPPAFLNITTTSTNSGQESSAVTSTKDEESTEKTSEKVEKSEKSEKPRRDRSGKKDSRSKRGGEKEPPVVPEPESEFDKAMTLEDVYEICDELGSGAFSVVKAGIHKKSKVRVAIKILENYGNLENAEEELESFQRETGIMQALNHHNIVKLMDVFEDDEHLYVVMECVAGGELFDQIIEKGSYQEDECCQVMIPVLQALAYMHERGIAHRDLKPENLLFSDQTHTQLKIVDFGESKVVGEGLSDYVGTPDYMAPEILKGQVYDMLVDMWAIGVVIYVMLCGFPPFDGESDTDVLCNIMNIAYDFPSPEWDDISENAKDFIRSLMTESDKRMSAAQALKHPWLGNGH